MGSEYRTNLSKFSNGQLALPMYCGLNKGLVFEWLKTIWPILPFEYWTVQFSDGGCIRSVLSANSTWWQWPLKFEIVIAAYRWRPERREKEGADATFRNRLKIPTFWNRNAIVPWLSDGPLNRRKSLRLQRPRNVSARLMQGILILRPDFINNFIDTVGREG